MIVPRARTLNWVVERSGPPRPSALNALAPLLAALGISDDDAEREWCKILDHKWYLSERVGRDVGLRTALVDYFENVHLPDAELSGRRSRLLALVAEPVLGPERDH
jgi:hypothetical protein